MGKKWYVRLKERVCELLGHPLTEGSPWEYNGQTHRVCAVCNRIISEQKGGE